MTSFPPGTLTRRLPVVTARLQGWYYVAGGLWAVLSPRTVQQITGLKLDFWVTQLFGLQLILLGAIVLLAARSGRIVREIALLALGEALFSSFTISTV